MGHATSGDNTTHAEDTLEPTRAALHVQLDENEVNIAKKRLDEHIGTRDDHNLVRLREHQRRYHDATTDEHREKIVMELHNAMSPATPTDDAHHDYQRHGDDGNNVAPTPGLHPQQAFTTQTEAKQHNIFEPLVDLTTPHTHSTAGPPQARPATATNQTAANLAPTSQRLAGFATRALRRHKTTAITMTRSRSTEARYAESFNRMAELEQLTGAQVFDMGTPRTRRTAPTTRTPEPVRGRERERVRHEQERPHHPGPRSCTTQTQPLVIDSQLLAFAGAMEDDLTRELQMNHRGEQVNVRPPGLTAMADVPKFGDDSAVEGQQQLNIDQHRANHPDAQTAHTAHIDNPPDPAPPTSIPRHEPQSRAHLPPSPPQHIPETPLHELAQDARTGVAEQVLQPISPTQDIPPSSAQPRTPDATLQGARDNFRQVDPPPGLHGTQFPHLKPSKATPVQLDTPPELRHDEDDLMGEEYGVLDARRADDSRKRQRPHPTEERDNKLDLILQRMTQQHAEQLQRHDDTKHEFRAIHQRVDRVEQQMEATKNDVEKHHNDINDSIADLNKRMEKLEAGGAGTATNDDKRRRQVVVFLGFPRESDKDVLIAKVKEMLDYWQIQERVTDVYCSTPYASSVKVRFKTANWAWELIDNQRNMTGLEWKGNTLRVVIENTLAEGQQRRVLMEGVNALKSTLQDGDIHEVKWAAAQGIIWYRGIRVGKRTPAHTMEWDEEILQQHNITMDMIQAATIANQRS